MLSHVNQKMFSLWPGVFLLANQSTPSTCHCCSLVLTTPPVSFFLSALIILVGGILYLTGHIQHFCSSFLPESVSRGRKREPNPNYPDCVLTISSRQVHRRINKQVKATVWMAHDYPLKLKHIMPALEILSVRVSQPLTLLLLFLPSG